MIVEKNGAEWPRRAMWLKGALARAWGRTSSLVRELLGLALLMAVLPSAAVVALLIWEWATYVPFKDPNWSWAFPELSSSVLLLVLVPPVVGVLGWYLRKKA